MIFSFNLLTIFFSRLENTTSLALGYANVPNLKEPNKLLVHLPIKLFNQTIINNTGKYDVWATDYKTYSLVYSCQKLLGGVTFEVAWILAREKTLPQSVVNQLKQIMQAGGVDASKFKYCDQTCASEI